MYQPMYIFVSAIQKTEHHKIKAWIETHTLYVHRQLNNSNFSYGINPETFHLVQ